jgi:hypothetical protein
LLQRSPTQTSAQAVVAGGGVLAAGAERGKAQAGAAIEVVLHRLEEVVDQETAALRSRKPVDLKDFNDRKSHALLDLSRALKQMQAGGKPQPQIERRLGELRVKLEENRRVLQMHLEAVREVSTRLSDAIRDQESDGTYGPAAAVRTAYSAS